MDSEGLDNLTSTQKLVLQVGNGLDAFLIGLAIAAACHNVIRFICVYKMRQFYMIAFYLLASFCLIAFEITAIA